MKVEKQLDGLEINHQLIKKARKVFRALNHRLRQSILSFIHKKGMVSVTEIYQSLKLEQSVCSQHLAILRRENIVTTVRNGRQILYAVNYKRIVQIHELASQLIQSGQPSIPN